jgi:4-diphosphocytidyl-2-C-methyl-D-erythritol kinase
MVLFPPAKINLGLFVTGKRPDGYHNLETVFYPVTPLYDVLEAVPAIDPGNPKMHLTGLPVQGVLESNLVWKAYKLLGEKFPQITPLDWHLHKAIPMGAGLGGGSSDGASALRLLNKVFNLGLSPEALEAYALELGSDCPFFIRAQAAFASGRGEVLEPLALSLSGWRIHVVPSGIHVSTAAAFKLLKPRPAPFDLRHLPAVPVEEWKEVLTNDFEEPVFSLHPELAQTKAALYANGAAYVQMSGSGSALFALYREENGSI